MKRLVFLFLLLVTNQVSYAQGYADLRAKALAHFESNRFEEALSAIEQSKVLAEKDLGDSHETYALILVDLGLIQIQNSLFEESFTSLLTAEKVLNTIEASDTATIKLWSELAIAYFIGGMATEAETYMIKAVDKAEQGKLKRSHELASLLGGLGEIQRGLGKYNEGELSMLRSRKLLEDLGLEKELDYATIHNNLASLYHDLARFTVADKYYGIAAKLYKRSLGESDDQYATCLQNWGELLIEMGDHNTALKNFKEVEAIKKKLFGEKSFSYAMIMNDMGYAHTYLGNYRKAESMYRRSLKIKELTVGNNHDSYLLTRHNLAMVYAYANLFSKAEEELQKVHDEVELSKEEDKLAYATYKTSLGNVQIRNKKYKLAEKNLKAALALFEELFSENHPEYLRVLNSLGYLYDVQGSNKKAVEYFELGYQRAKGSNECPASLKFTCINNRAYAYQREEKHKEALSLFKEAHELITKNSSVSNPDVRSAEINLAISYSNDDQLDEADKLFKRALDAHIQDINNNISWLPEPEKERALAEFKLALNAYYTHAFKADLNNSKVAGDILNYRMASKAILLNANSSAKNTILNSNDEDLLAKFNEQRKLKNFLSKVYSFSAEEIAASKVNVDSLEQLVAVLDKELSLAGLRGNIEVVSWKDIHKHLEKDEAIVEIIYSENTTASGNAYAAIVLSGNEGEPMLRFLPQLAKNADVYLENYRRNAKKNMHDTASFNVFLKRVYELTPTANTIYFSGDGVYNYVNLNTLYSSAWKDNLIDEYDIHYVINPADVVAYKKQKKSKPNDAIVALFGYPDYTMALNVDGAKQNIIEEQGFGEVLALNRASSIGDWELPPLPGTKTEVEEIHKVFNAYGIKSNTYFSQSSTEGAIKALKNPYVLHIATHGYFKPASNSMKATAQVPEQLQRAVNNPMLRSGLMLAGASNSYGVNYSDVVSWEDYEDGILTAYEAQNMELDSTEIVVLSACQTGLGEVKNGEGVYGLQRAFFVAGAKSVIMSLWSVSDNATKDLMIAFYTYWLRTGDKHVAFRQAQKDVKEKYKLPYYWGAFVLLERY